MDTSRKVLDCNKQARTLLQSDIFHLGEEIESYTTLILVDDGEWRYSFMAEMTGIYEISVYSASRII